MARPITNIKKSAPSEAEQQAEAIGVILKSLTENREAIVETVEILSHLHEIGVLAAVKALLIQRNEVGRLAIQQLNQPSMQHLIKNAMTAVQTIGSIQPDQLQRLLNGLTGALGQTGNQNAAANAPTLWELARSMKDPEVRTSLYAMIGILKGMGKSFQNDSRPVH
ncbi:DUF1641 domain-containing protein [Brevibacillus fulvus]|uniref:Uncharacterized protein YjgD (DUF1641 family) n=1 Tax=Brevibacillus fulvus TaxID=1125967 RepID=A0A938XZS2_9BACL|nr:DUF1641 domain-containing protein [Brevibacillus fulvus]MBM7588912.1 uncharacterized protein YjgD (DUF1641 family) [Brevibacillus fulvus]